MIVSGVSVTAINIRHPSRSIKIFSRWVVGSMKIVPPFSSAFYCVVAGRPFKVFSVHLIPSNFLYPSVLPRYWGCQSIPEGKIDIKSWNEDHIKRAPADVAYSSRENLEAAALYGMKPTLQRQA